MAYQATNWAWEIDLPMTQKFTLIALADMADETYSCYPGQDRLAKMIGASVDTVQRALKALEAGELISRLARRRDDGYRTSDRYQLHVGRSARKLRPKNLTPQSAPSHTAMSTDLTPHSAGVITSKNHQESPDLFELVIHEPDVGFEEFYSAYPRHVGRAAAEKKFVALVKSKKVTAAALVEGARRFAADPNLPTDRNFIPHPATWLNQGRWEDEPLPPRGGSEKQQQTMSLIEQYQREEQADAEVGDGEGLGLRSGRGPARGQQALGRDVA